MSTQPPFVPGTVEAIAKLLAEAGLFQRIRDLSGVEADGASLIDRVFSVEKPFRAFNTLQTETEKSEVKYNSKYIRELLRKWFNMHYASAKGPLADNLRRAICWVDEALNMGDCK